MIAFKLLPKTALLAAVLLTGCSTTSSDTGSSSGTDTPTSANPANKPLKTILVFGDSLTAGYGLDDPAEAFPGVIQARIDSLQLPYRVVNSGVSGETSAGGLARIDWVLKQKPDLFLLELGANDGLRGLPVKQTRENLQAIIDKVKAKYPDTKIILLGMQVPPSMGAAYAGDFRQLFPNLASRNRIGLVPFLLENVGGVAKLNQRDGIHPTREGARILAENVWVELKKELE